MADAGKVYAYAFFVSLCALALLSERSMANVESQDSKRIQKRAAGYDDWKRGQSGYLTDLESALGTMQRPRFGKRYIPDDPLDGYVIITDKRGNSIVDIGAALGTIQRPRFGRRR